MPARDLFHDAVRNALMKDGWTITHDPFRIPFGERTVYVDLAAERVIAAERGQERIAVEVKTFLGPSELHEFHSAVGQYASYRIILSRVEPERRLFLAVPKGIMEGFFQEPIARLVLQDLTVSVLAYDPDREVITAWKV
jgi:Holliday junction resolvase-like predicted endonuclease